MPKNNKPNFAFIDSQNLNLGVRSLGWKIDYRKLRLYLKNKYNVTEAYLFIGKVSGNQSLYTALQKSGYILVFKPTVAYVENGKKTMKGNVDAELVLYAAAKVYNQYDKAILISGDGDFYCLAEYLLENDKLLNILVPNKRFSKLLKGFTRQIVRLDLLQNKLSYTPGQIKNSSHGRSKP